MSRLDRSRVGFHQGFSYLCPPCLPRYGGILNADGSLNKEAIHRIFVRFDRDKNGLITREELAGDFHHHYIHARKVFMYMMMILGHLQGCSWEWISLQTTIPDFLMRSSTPGSIRPT